MYRREEFQYLQNPLTPEEYWQLPLIQQAKRLVDSFFADKLRKGSQPEPYVTHLYEVAETLMFLNAEPESVAAGLLHDILEDTDYTIEELYESFPYDTAVDVTVVTEHNKDLPWKKRKELAAAKLWDYEPRQRDLKMADILSNLRSLRRGLDNEGHQFFDNFKADRSLLEWRFRMLLDILQEIDPLHPLLPEVEYLVNYIFPLTR